MFSRVFGRRWELVRWSTGEQAVEAFRSGGGLAAGVAVLLVDHDLPGINGVAVIEHVRASPGGDVPVVCMVSGSGRAEVPAAALGAGADAFIAKPSTATGLRALEAQVAMLAEGR